jgi:NAD(P)-dependent dehydrogenase (short-subunit alcohol dehydrogenase family)
LKKKEIFEELFDLTGKVSVVTGGSNGLGRAMAETLAVAGSRVAICSRNGVEAEKVAKEISDTTRQVCIGLGADVSRKADVDGFFASVEREIGPVDILIANAGINAKKDIVASTEEDWDAIMDINLKGSFLCAKAVVPGMRQKQWGRIILLGSMLSYVSIPGRTAYASSKAGILGLTRTLALECARNGICVNAICPGPFKTRMNLDLRQDDEKNRTFLANLPIGRWGEPSELKGLTLYLSSRACSFMTGTCIAIDGGWTSQ